MLRTGENICGGRIPYHSANGSSANGIFRFVKYYDHNKAECSAEEGSKTLQQLYNYHSKKLAPGSKHQIANKTPEVIDLTQSDTEADTDKDTRTLHQGNGPMHMVVDSDTDVVENLSTSQRSSEKKRRWEEDGFELTGHKRAFVDLTMDTAEVQPTRQSKFVTQIIPSIPISPELKTTSTRCDSLISPYSLPTLDPQPRPSKRQHQTNTDIPHADLQEILRRWNDQAISCGAAGIEFVNDQDDEPYPASIDQNFEYLEMTFR